MDLRVSDPDLQVSILHRVVQRGCLLNIGYVDFCPTSDQNLHHFCVVLKCAQVQGLPHVGLVHLVTETVDIRPLHPLGYQQLSGQQLIPAFDNLEEIGFVKFPPD